MSSSQSKHIRLKTALAVLLGAVLCVGALGRAEILYFDDFDGPASTDLDGFAPDTRSGTYGTSAAATWSAAVNYDANGLMWSSPNGSGTARLDFTPVAGEVYALSADFEGLSTWAGQQDDWISLGFFDGATKYAWMRIGSHSSGTGREVGYFAGANETDGGIVATTLGVRNLKVVLDTTDTNWTVGWYLDDVQLGSTFTYITNPNITTVGFGRFDNARSNFDNFQLAVIPEPSSLLLTLSAGLAGLLFFRRRVA